MNDDTLQRRAEIIEAIYRHGMMPTWELAEHLDLTPEELVVDVAALVEQGTLTTPTANGMCCVTDKAIETMDAGVRMAATCALAGADFTTALGHIATFGALAWEASCALREVAPMIGERGRSLLARIDGDPCLAHYVKQAHGAYVRNTTPPDWPHITLADCAAWAEAIVVALEAEGLTAQRVYGDALFLARSTATRSRDAERTSLDSMRWLVLAEARAGQLRIARAYSAIIAVRMLAAEAVRREQT